MPEIDSEALLRRDFFFFVNKRRAEEKILELNNQLIQGLMLFSLFCFVCSS